MQDNQTTQTNSPTQVYDYNTGKPLQPGQQQSQFNTQTGQKIGTDTSATNPVIPVSTITNTPTYNIPNNINQNQNNAYKNAINTSQGALLGLTGSNTNQATQDYNQSKSQVNDLINQYLGKGAEQAQKEQDTGALQLQSTANSLNNQYLTQQSIYNQQYNDILNRPGDAAAKEQEISALQKQHAYNLTNTALQASIASTNYTNAENIINHQIDIKYAPIKDAIDYGMQFVAQNKDILTQKQQQQFNAQLQVQSQTYEQNKLYSQLDATNAIQMVKDAAENGAPADIQRQMSQIISSGGSSSDVASVASNYLKKGNYSVAWNPATNTMEPFNSTTGLFNSGGIVPSNSPVYNPADPNSSTITSADGTKYNLKGWATDPSNVPSVISTLSNIKQNYGNVLNADTAQQVINKYAPTSTVNGQMIIDAARNAGVDPTMLLAQMQIESGIGSSNVALKNNNFGGLTYNGQKQIGGVPVTIGTARPDSEGGNYAKFSTPQDGLKAQANLLAARKVQPTSQNIGITPTVEQSIKTFNQIKAQAPSYISQAMGVISTTGDKYIDKSLLTDPTGAPSTVAANQASTYQALGFKILSHDQVLALQDADQALIQINNIEEQWRAVAPNGYLERSAQATFDPLTKKFLPNNNRTLSLTSYGTLLPTAISTLNNITGSKRLSQFSSNISEDALPKLSSSWFGALTTIPTAGISASGDTLETGLQKLDNLRKDVNASITPIIGSKGAPLSSDYVSIQKPDGTTAFDYITNNIKDAFNSGIQQATQDFKEAGQAKDPLTLLEKSTGMVAGAANAVTSPLAPVFAPLGYAINKIGEQLGNNPDLQKFANGDGGKILQRIAQDVSNLTSIASLVAGGEEAPTIANIAKEKAVNTIDNVGNVTNGITSPLTDLIKPSLKDAQNTLGSFIPALADNSPETLINNRLDSLKQIEGNNKGLRDIANNASNKNIDVKNLIANTDLLEGSVNQDGTIDTLSKGGSVDQFNKIIEPYESLVSDALKNEGKSISFDNVKNYFTDILDNSRLAGGAKSTLKNSINKELNGLKLDVDENGNIPLSKIQDAKISTTGEIDYNKPSSKTNAKTIGNAYKTLIEKNSSLPIEKVNEELSKFYTIRDYLESLNGKKVKGGRLGKYFASTVGAMVGSHFGPLGTIIGEHLGSKLKGTELESTFGKGLNKDIQVPEILKNLAKDNQEKSSGNQIAASTIASNNSNIPEVNLKNNINASEGVDNSLVKNKVNKKTRKINNKTI